MKSIVLEQVRSELRDRFEVLSRAAREAHGAATDPDSKAEGKYDTRSLEASYLASGQSRALEDLGESIRLLDALVAPDFCDDDEVRPGALVEVETSDGPVLYLLVPAAGGMEVSTDQGVVTLLSPSSRLYQRLLGGRVGDVLGDSNDWIASVS